MSNIAPPPKSLCYFVGHGSNVTALHFPNEIDDVIRVPSLISGSKNGEIFIWNLETLKTYHRISSHNGKMIMYLCYYNSCLISQGRDGNIHLWKLANDHWEIINSFPSSDHGFCASILFPTDSIAYLAVPTENSLITFYDYETSKVLSEYKPREETHTKQILETCICMKVFMQDKKLFLLAGYDSGYVVLWDYEADAEICRLKCHSALVSALDYDSKFRNRGISGSIDDILEVWKRTEDNQLVKVHQVTLTNPGIQAIKIRDDGKIVITGGKDGYVRIFSWKSLKPLAVLNCHKKPICSLQLRTEPYQNKNTMIFASGSEDTHICLSAVYF